MRDTNGRFLPGNPGGPGRPKRATEVEFLRGLTDAVSPDDWTAIVRRAVADAKMGDARAREWLGAYLVGRPGAPAPALGKLDDIEFFRDTMNF